MEVQLFQVFVIYLIAVGSYVNTLIYGRTGYVEKYITRAYFEKHENLIDSEFKNFIANEIPLGLCKVFKDGNCVIPVLSHLHRRIIGEGSHRRLSSSIVFNLQPELKSELTMHSCEIITIERLPSGVLADPFELQHLVQRGVFSNAAVFGDTNLELPSFRSNQSVVEIQMSVASKMLSIYADHLEVNLMVPLHARYQPLGHGFSRVEFGQPDLFTCCSPQGNALNRSCAVIPTDHISDLKPSPSPSPVVWDIPCGMKEHAGVVSAVTFGFVAVAAVLIVLTSVCCSNSKLKNY